MTIEDLEQRVMQLESMVSLLEARETRNEIVAIALTRILFRQGILPLTPDLKDLLIYPDEMENNND